MRGKIKALIQTSIILNFADYNRKDSPNAEFLWRCAWIELFRLEEL